MFCAAAVKGNLEPEGSRGNIWFNCNVRWYMYVLGRGGEELCHRIWCPLSHRFLFTPTDYQHFPKCCIHLFVVNRLTNSNTSHWPRMKTACLVIPCMVGCMYTFTFNFTMTLCWYLSWTVMLGSPSVGIKVGLSCWVHKISWSSQGLLLVSSLCT